MVMMKKFNSEKQKKNGQIVIFVGNIERFNKDRNLNFIIIVLKIKRFK